MPAGGGAVLAPRPYAGTYWHWRDAPGSLVRVTGIVSTRHGSVVEFTETHGGGSRVLNSMLAENFVAVMAMAPTPWDDPRSQPLADCRLYSESRGPVSER